MVTYLHPHAAPYAADGSRPDAVVLVHGFTGSPAHLRPLAEELHARGYSVRAPLLAGHGTEPGHLRYAKAGDWVASARVAVDEVRDRGRVHLVGLSMGGLISLVLAAEVGASSVCTINTPLVVRDKLTYVAPLASRLRPVVSWPAQEPDIEPSMLPYWQGYECFPTKAAAGLVALMGRAVPAARALDLPALVVQSRTDETVDPRSSDLLAGLLGARASQVWLGHSLHIATLDRERHRITDALVRHLENAGAAGGPAPTGPRV